MRGLDDGDPAAWVVLLDDLPVTGSVGFDEAERLFSLSRVDLLEELGPEAVAVHQRALGARRSALGSLRSEANRESIETVRARLFGPRDTAAEGVKTDIGDPSVRDLGDPLRSWPDEGYRGVAFPTGQGTNHEADSFAYSHGPARRSRRASVPIMHRCMPIDPQLVRPFAERLDAPKLVAEPKVRWRDRLASALAGGIAALLTIWVLSALGLR